MSTFIEVIMDEQSNAHYLLHPVAGLTAEQYGIILASLAKHVAAMLAVETTVDKAAAHNAIFNAFVSETNVPTDAGEAQSAGMH